MVSLCCEEMIFDSLAMNASGPEDGGREVQLISRIRDIPRLQHQTRGLAVNYAAMAGEHADRFIRCLYLNARQIGVDLWHASAYWIVGPVARCGCSIGCHPCSNEYVSRSKQYQFPPPLPG